LCNNTIDYEVVICNDMSCNVTSRTFNIDNICVFST